MACPLDYKTYTNMSIKVKFKVSDKLVKARDGANYDIKNYVEGVDYVMRGCFKGVKAVFRADILGEPQQQEPPVVDEFEAMQGVSDACELLQPSEPQPEDWRLQAPEPAKPVEPPQPQTSNDVQECKIKKIYANFKWVETDKGRVWVGLKGHTMRLGQIIRVKNGELYLKRV